MSKFDLMKQIVIVDIDGTIADPEHRLHYITGENQDHTNFYSKVSGDTPIKEICKLVNLLSLNYNLLFVTGRRESCRTATILWIDTHVVGIDSSQLLMRSNGDRRPDEKVKIDLFSKFLASKDLTWDALEFVLEDRNVMVDKWRSLGQTCLQVKDGNY